jgi:hypothetical protein
MSEPTPYGQKGIVDVQINGGTLRVGGDAYALKSIARTQVRKLEPRRNLIFRYLGTAAFLLVGSVFITFAMEGIGVPGTIAYDVLYLIAIVWFVVITGNLLISLPREKRKLTYYTLVIETAGTAQTLLADTDEVPVRELASVIAAALGSPDVSVQLEAKSQLASAIRQYGKPGNRRKLTRAELDGTLRVLITRGSGYSGTGKKYTKAKEWLGLNGAQEDHKFSSTYLVTPDCKAFRRMKGDVDIDEYLRKLYLRRIDRDDPWFWSGFPDENRRTRAKALTALGHDWESAK